MSRAAQRRLDAFRQRFGRYSQAHLDLARQAAVPLALTPDLLYRLWAAFQRDAHGAPLRIPWVAVADLLLSNLCRETGFELYELDREVRALLLDELATDARLGPQRRDEIARFLLEYVRQLQHSPDPDALRFAEAQQWAALAYLQPGPTLQQLQQHLEAARQAGQVELLRLSALAETLAPALRAQPGGAELLAQARERATQARNAPAAPPAPRETPAEVASDTPAQAAEDWSARLETRFVLAQPDETLGQILARLPADRRERAATYVVAPREGGGYLVARWHELELSTASKERTFIHQRQVAAILGTSSVTEIIDLISASLAEAQELLAIQPNRRLVILEGGAVFGVLTNDPPLPEDLGPDPFAFSEAEPTEAEPLPPTPMGQQTFGQSDMYVPHEQPPRETVDEQGPLPPTPMGQQTFGQSDVYVPGELPPRETVDEQGPLPPTPMGQQTFDQSDMYTSDEQAPPQQLGGTGVAPFGPPTTLDGLLVELRACQAALDQAAAQLGAPGEDAADSLGAAVRALERAHNFPRAHAKLSEALDRLRALEGTATIADSLYARLVDVASFFEQIWSQSESGGQPEAE